MNTEREMLPTRQSLLSRLRDWDDSVSWQDFFDTYWRLIYRTARRAGLVDTEAQDVVQETLLTVCQQIREFQYDPQRSFKSWLLKTTAWRIRDRLRRRPRDRMEPLDIDDETLSLAAEDSIAERWEADWERNLVDAAMERLKKQAPPKQFQIFDLAVMRGWPTAKIARTLSVSSGYVYVTKHRISVQLKREVRRLRQDPCEGWNSRPASPPMNVA